VKNEWVMDGQGWPYRRGLKTNILGNKSLGQFETMTRNVGLKWWKHWIAKQFSNFHISVAQSCP